MSDRVKRRAQRAAKSAQHSADRRSGKEALRQAVDGALYASDPVEDFADHFETAGAEASAIVAPVKVAPAFKVNTIAKDRYWPKPIDTLADWDKASGQAGLLAAERAGVQQLLARKGGAFNIEGDLRAEAGDSECGRRRHISGKHVQTSQAIVDLQDAGFAPGQAKHMVDPKRGSRSRGFTYEA